MGSFTSEWHRSYSLILEPQLPSLGSSLVALGLAAQGGTPGPDEAKMCQTQFLVENIGFKQSRMWHQTPMLNGFCALLKLEFATTESDTTGVESILGPWGGVRLHDPTCPNWWLRTFQLGLRCSNYLSKTSLDIFREHKLRSKQPEGSGPKTCVGRTNCHLLALHERQPCILHNS